ncbi:hypothetical protein N9O70_02500 [bacterium]|nr:hypothetical protein [bacterium]
MSVSLVAATNADQTLDLLTVDANAETANIAVSGATGTGKELTLTSLIADGAKTINITGSGNLITQLNETGTNATTLIDASTATGVLAITENVGNKITIKGSQGQNTINMGTGLLNTDTIIGGASTKDTVTATVGTAQTATTGVLNLTDVETLSLTHTSGQNATIDLTSSTGVAAIAVTGSASNATGTLTLKGLANGTTVATQDTNSFDGTLALALADATGTSDSVTLSVTSATASDDDFTITGTGIETLAITAGATDAQTTDIDASGFAASTITIAGGTAASNMFLGGATLNKTVTSVDASSFAGDVTLDASAALSTGVDFKLGNISITTTTGDTVTGSASTTTQDSLSGTFAVTDATAEFTQFSGIENYTLTINDAVDITAASNDGIGDGDAVVKTITFTGGNSASSYTAADAIDGAKLTSFDASGFNGTMSVNVAGSIMKNVTMKAGGTALDSLVYSGVNGLSSAAAVGTGVATASGYESVAFRTATAASSIDMSGVTGATFVGVQGDQNLTLSKLAAGVVIGVGESQAQDNYSGTLTAALADATGSADSLTFKLANQAADDQIDAKLVTSGIETVTISHTATAGQNDADLDVSGITAGTLVITGGSVAEDLDLTNGDNSTLNAATSIVNASANASVLHVTASTNTSTAFTAAGSNVDLIGSVVADSFTIGTAAAGISAAITTIDGGTGSDTLVVNSKAGGSLVNVEAVENITVNVVGLTGTTSTVTIAASSKGANDASLVTLTGGLAGNTTTFAGAITDHAVTIDGSTFVGNMGLTFGDDALIQTNLADPITIKGGSGTKDTVTVSASNSDTGAFTMSGIETLVFGNDTGASVLQLVNVTDLGTIVLTDDAGTATAVSITTYTDQMINLGVTGGAGFDNTSVTVAKTAMTGTADVVNFTAAETDETTNAVTLAVDGFETVNLALANDAAAGTGDDHKIAITNTNTNAVTLNVTGTDTLADLTLSAIADSITTIAAGGVAGSITMAARSSTGVMTITTGAGNDTVLMNNANDVLDGGTKAVTGDSDTLTVSGALVLGGIQVDLSSATDQVTTYNGVTNSAVQKNFENVDLSGVTGFGSVIQAGTAGSTITGTALTDQITGGKGADSIYLTKGNDVLVGGNGTDTLYVKNANNGGLIEDADAAGNKIDLNAGTIGWDDAASASHSQTIATVENVDASLQLDADVDLTIKGTSGSNTIYSGAGADVIDLTSGGVDTLGYQTGTVAQTDTVTGFVAGGDKLAFDADLLAGVSSTGALAAANYAEATITTLGATADATTDNDDDAVHNALDALANIATAQVIVLIDGDGGANTLVAAEADSGLALSDATGSGFVVLVVSDAAATATTLYYDPDFTNAGDLVQIGAITTTGTNTSAAALSAADFLVI